MAEAFAVLGALTTICTVASGTLKLTEKLYNVARDLGSAGDDVEDFAMTVGNFSSVIMTAQRTLKQYCSGKQTHEMLLYLAKEKVIDSLAKQSKRISKRIKQFQPQIKNLASRLTVISRVKWMFEKARVQALKLAMESVKSDLNLLVTTVHLAIYMQNANSSEELYVDVALYLIRL